MIVGPAILREPNIVWGWAKSSSMGGDGRIEWNDSLVKFLQIKWGE